MWKIHLNKQLDVNQRPRKPLFRYLTINMAIYIYLQISGQFVGTCAVHERSRDHDSSLNMEHTPKQTLGRWSATSKTPILTYNLTVKIKNRNFEFPLNFVAVAGKQWFFAIYGKTKGRRGKIMWYALSKSTIAVILHLMLGLYDLPIKS